MPKLMITVHPPDFSYCSSFHFKAFLSFTLLSIVLFSPEPLGGSPGELTVTHALASVPLSVSVHIFKDLFLLNRSKFHAEPPWEEGTKICEKWSKS